MYKLSLLLHALLFLYSFSPGQTLLHYTIQYTDSTSSKVSVQIQLPRPVLSDTASFIMPRCVPGNYEITLYDKFVLDPVAVDIKGKSSRMLKYQSDAPRWLVIDTGILITSISYSVDLAAMEKRMDDLSLTSVQRKNYVGLLNYSILGWVGGTENQKLTCTVETLAGWPVYTTLSPSDQPAAGSCNFEAANYYELADGQTLLGAFRVKRFNGLVPVYVVDYSETTPSYLDDYGWFGTNSLAVLKDYYGSIPFQHYTIFTQHIIPVDPQRKGFFAMEHLCSATFFGDTSDIRTAAWPEAIRFRKSLGTLHHMGHAFIPLRCYGDRYLPHVTELPVIQNMIWFNEGFTWFLCMDTLHSKDLKDYFQYEVFKNDQVIKDLSLTDLSQIASVAYGQDFRLGMSVFSRGALMADAFNDLIKSRTANKKSMRDVLRYLYGWSQSHHRPFTAAELPELIKEASGVDVSDLYQKWQEPIF